MWGHIENRGKENRVNRGWLIVQNGRKKDRIINHVKSKIVEIETAEIEECLYVSQGRTKYIF